MKKTNRKMMSKCSNLLVAALAVLIFAGGVHADAEDLSDTKVVVGGNAAFALDLYGNLKEAEGNLFFSPYSISTALAMTYAGARGITENQMAKVLHFTLDQKRLHPAFSCLETQLNAAKEKGSVELSVANALWAQKEFVFIEDFLDLTKKNYRAALELADFKRAHEEVRKKINTWVEQQTRNKIRDLIKPGVLDALTRLVLVNAIYFKGNWAYQFKKNLTKDAPFFSHAQGNSVEAPLMTQKRKFGYAETDSLQILELPYVGNDLSMIVLLPRELDGLCELENRLTSEKLEKWTGLLREREVEVFLPKFKMTSQFSLGKTLAAMGMPHAFGGSADFSGINGKKDLCISAVIHKAFVEVNEEGTEAAAATAVAVRLTSAPPSPPPVFLADHPFLFLIRHNQSGSILFFGRIINPNE